MMMTAFYCDVWGLHWIEKHLHTHTLTFFCVCACACVQIVKQTQTQRLWWCTLSDTYWNVIITLTLWPAACFFFGLVRLGRYVDGLHIQLLPWLETLFRIHNQSLWQDVPPRLRTKKMGGEKWKGGWMFVLIKYGHTKIRHSVLINTSCPLCWCVWTSGLEHLCLPSNTDDDESAEIITNLKLPIRVRLSAHTVRAAKYGWETMSGYEIQLERHTKQCHWPIETPAVLKSYA